MTDAVLPRPRRTPPPVRRGASAAVVSTTAALVVAVLLVRSSPGWPRVRESFFDADVALASAPAIAHGLLLNLLVLVCAVPVVLVLGLVVALLRRLPGPLWFPVRALAVAYVDFFRGIPLLVCLFIVGFGLPSLRLTGIPNDPVLLGGLALVLVYSAYVAEVFRAGFEDMDPQLGEAASLDGATRWQALWMVELPQVLRSQHPNLLSNFVALQKDCGFISVLGAIDAVQAARIASAQSFTFTPYMVAAVFFVALSIPSGRLADYLSRRSARPDRPAADAG